MIRAKRVKLKNFVVYDQAEYVFKDGLSVVRGQNRTGKSLIFSALGNLLYGAPPIIKSKRAAKQMHVRAGSKIQFDFEVNGKSATIIQALTGSSIKYSIRTEDNDFGTVNQTDAFGIIRELVPTPEDLFYSSVYIAGARSHPLHLGTGAERMRYLESMFDFHTFDELRKRLGELLSKSKESIAEAEALKAELASLPTGKSVPKPYIKRLETANDYILRNIEKKDNVQRLIGERDALLKSEVVRTMTASSIEDMLSDITEKVEKLDKKYLNKQKNTEKASQYKQDVKKLPKMKDKVSKVEDKLKIYNLFKKFNLKPTEFGQALVKAESDYRWKLEYCDKLEEEKAVNDEIMAILLKIFSKKQAMEFLKKIRKEEAKCDNIINEFEEAERLGLEENRKCPTCGQKVKSLKINKDKYEDAKANFRIIKRIYDIGIYSERAEKLKQEKRDLKEAKETFETFKKQSKLIEELNDLKEKLGFIKERIRENEEFKDSNIDVNQLRVTLLGLKARRKELKGNLEDRYRVEFLNNKINEFSFDYKVSTDDVKTLAKALSEIKSESRIISKTTKRANEIKKRLKELGKIADKEDFYSILYDTYGPRGLRVEHMSIIAQTLESSFNRFAPSIFPEPIYFTFNVAPSQVSVSVENNSLSPSDSSSLSGSEVRCFQILCFAALSPYIPSKYRFDSVVLDEVEAMMTPETRKIFTQLAIPQIKEAVRSLTIVTPLPEEEMFIDEARSYQVVKNNAKSIIEEIK